MSEYKAKQMAKNYQAVKDFCEGHGLNVVELNHGYQLRIEETFDVYPVRQRWHFLVDGSRGGWTDLENLRRIMIRKLEAPEMGNYNHDGSVPKADATISLKPRPQVMNIIIDEVSEWPDYKWYRNPFKWYSWRRTVRKLLRQSKRSFIQVQSNDPDSYELPKYNAIYKKEK